MERIGYFIVLSIFVIQSLLPVCSIFTSLIIRREIIPGLKGFKVTVNGTSPGPIIRLITGQIYQISVVNQLTDDATGVHWHGFSQFKTPFSDGVIGTTQCPISNIAGSNTMIYEFNPSIAATYFYHGHFHDQYPDGLIGAMVVTSDLEKQKLKALSVSYDYDIDEFVWLAADYYEAPARSLLTSYYLTNQSGGNEPIPDGYLLNGKLSNSLTLLANRAASYRVRFVNAAALSMFNISVDGMPLTIIEIDGNIVRPYEVSYFVTNVAQRVGFVLNFSRLAPSLQKSPAIWFRLTGIPSMYATYNASLPNNGLYGTVSNQPLNLYWTGVISFKSLSSKPNYGNQLVPPHPLVGGPSDNNLLAAQNYPPVPTPTYSYAINFTIAFAADAAGVNIALFNNVTYAPPPGASARGNTSLLFSYLQPRALHSPAPHHQGRFVYDSSSKLNYSLGDGAHPFVLPSQQGVLVRIFNTDTGEHPIHIHGHNFWILSTSDFPEAEHYPTHLQRSVISVPAEGWAKIVLFTDNPGVWFFHCHIDWHVAAGLGANIIEAPELIAATAYAIPPSMISACNVKYPSQAPVKLSASPTLKPTTKSTTSKPTVRPTVKPSEKPSVRPTVHPTASMSTNPNPVTPLGTKSPAPSIKPSSYHPSTSSGPTSKPVASKNPSDSPTKSVQPTTILPMASPTRSPSLKSSAKSAGPTRKPSGPI